MTADRSATNHKRPVRPAAFRALPSLVAAAIAGVALSAAAFGQDDLPPLELPVDCEIGSGCVIQNYFDHDPGPEAEDYACGPLTYDGHRGTDFRVPDLAAMAAGVPVVAAAAGEVRAVRDGMPDIDARERDRAAIAGREAGNAVVLVHPGGWETQYSHLREGSVAVKPGDRVVAGQPLGQIGMSGFAEFPHMHFELRRGERRVDPFVGLDPPAGCGAGAAPLWSAEALDVLGYSGGGLLSLGFADSPPDFADIRQGVLDAEFLPRDIPALVFWVNLYGVRPGDVFDARLVGPDGTLVAEQRVSLERQQAQWFGYLGRRRRGAEWPAGVYRGAFTVLRPGGAAQRTVASGSGEVVLR